MISVTNKNFWITEQFERIPDKIFLQTQNEKISYKLFFEHSLTFAEYLKCNGVKENDHIAIIFDHSFEFLIVVQSLWFLKAIPIPLNYKLNIEEIKIQLKISDAQYLIRKKINDNSTNVSDIHEIIFDLEEVKTYTKLNQINNFDADSLALMLFTSGSTGNPKCVQLSFNNFYESAKSADEYIKHGFPDIWLASLPFYHIGGFSIFTRSLISGCNIVIPESVSTSDQIESINKFNPTLVSLVPTMLQKIIERYPKSWESLRIAFVGGGPTERNLIINAIKSGWQISVVYGATETASMITVASSQNIISNGLSAGKPLTGVEIKFENQKIIVKSKSVAKGYYHLENNVDQQIFNGEYFSNDIGEIDQFGNLQIIGRSDDIIISGGENISLLEIEQLLNEVEHIKQCVALGIKDEKWGESYIIVSDSNSADLENRIINVLSRKVGRFKLPSKIIFVEKIPTSSVGKTRKSKLKNKLNFDFL
jgi:O-succinylbenzoic acid--CoA ligase